MSNLIPNPDTKQSNTESGPPVNMTDFSSLMLPQFESEEAGSPSHQVEKLTPSTPIMISESTRATITETNTLLAVSLPLVEELLEPMELTS